MSHDARFRRTPPGLSRSVEPTINTSRAHAPSPQTRLYLISLQPAACLSSKDPRHTAMWQQQSRTLPGLSWLVEHTISTSRTHTPSTPDSTLFCLLRCKISANPAWNIKAGRAYYRHIESTYSKPPTLPYLVTADCMCLVEGLLSDQLVVTITVLEKFGGLASDFNNYLYKEPSLAGSGPIYFGWSNSLPKQFTKQLAKGFKIRRV